MMDERFTQFHFSTPLPLPDRDPSWVHCGRCCAKFHLETAAAVGTPEASWPQPARVLEGGVSLDKLRELVDLKSAGHLDEEEFRAAKRRLLGLS